MRKFILLGMVSGIYGYGFTEPVKSLVEFFSFKCAHCANVNDRLSEYIAKHGIKFMDVNLDVDGNTGALNTMVMEYIAEDSGVGDEFKQDYFMALRSGMVAYDQNTLNYVVKMVMNPLMNKLMHSEKEKQRIKDKIAYGEDLVRKYGVSETPTFLINQSVILSGEDVINSLEANSE